MRTALAFAFAAPIGATAPIRASQQLAVGSEFADADRHIRSQVVAAAGGWAGADTLVRCYQQAHHMAMLAVGLGALRRWLPSRKLQRSGSVAQLDRALASGASRSDLADRYPAALIITTTSFQTIT